MSTSGTIIHSWNSDNRMACNSPLWHYVDNPVDLAFADPPYNYSVNYDGDETGDCMPVPDYRYWIAQVMAKLAQTVKDGGMLFWLCPSEDGYWTWDLLRRIGTLMWDRPIIWHERFSQYQKARLTADYRFLFPVKIGNRLPTFNPNAIREESVRQKMNDKRADPDGRVPGHVWTISRLQGNHGSRVDWHPAQLPPLPLARIVKGWTNEDDTVMDAFAGAGSMGVVCKGLGRNFVGIEQSAEYCNKIMARIDAAPDKLVLPKKGHV